MIGVILLVNVIVFASHVTSSFQPLTKREFVKRGLTPLKDADGFEIDLNIPPPAKETSSMDHEMSSSLPNRKGELQNMNMNPSLQKGEKEEDDHHPAKPFISRRMKNELSQTKHAKKLRVFRETLHKDPQKHKTCLKNERKRKEGKPRKRYPAHSVYLARLEKENKITDRQREQLTEYRKKTRINQGRYRIKHRKKKDSNRATD